MKNKSGFTMLELVVVIGIIAIMSAVIMPNMLGWITDERVKSSINDIHSLIQFTKLKAIKERANVIISFDPDNNSTLANDYIAFVDDGAGGGTLNNWIQDGSEETVGQGTIPDDVNMYEVIFPNPEPFKIRFNSRGLPNGTGGHVYMVNNKNKYMGVIVNIAGNPRIVWSSTGAVNTWNDYE